MGRPTIELRGFMSDPLKVTFTFKHSMLKVHFQHRIVLEPGSTWYKLNMITLDPNRIRTTRRFPSVEELLDLIPRELLMKVEIDQGTMTKLIELMLVNGPMPAIVIRMNADGLISAIGSGSTFVAALSMFRDGRCMGSTRWIADWHCKCLADLPPAIQRRFRRRELDVTVIEPGTPDDAAEALIETLAAG